MNPLAIIQLISVLLPLVEEAIRIITQMTQPQLMNEAPAAHAKAALIRATGCDPDLAEIAARMAAHLTR